MNNDNTPLALETTRTGHTPGPWTWRDAPGAGIQISATLPEGFQFDTTDLGADGNSSFMTFTLRSSCQVQIADARWVQFETRSWSEMQAANAERIISCVNACEGINPEAVPELLAITEYFAGFAPTDRHYVDGEEIDDSDEATITITVGALREAAEAIARAKGGAP